MTSLVTLTLIATPAAQASSSERSEPELVWRPKPRSDTCKSARVAAFYYRMRTWTWQELRDGRLATRTPIVAGKSCHWAKFAAREWKARAFSWLLTLTSVRRRV